MSEKGNEVFGTHNEDSAKVVDFEGDVLDTRDLAEIVSDIIGSTNTKNSKFGCLIMSAMFLLVLASMPISYLISGFTLMTLWGWFVVPLGVPAITLVHAMGLALLISFVKLGLQTAVQSDETVKKNPLATLFSFTIVYWLAQAFALCIGWVLHLFM